MLKEIEYTELDGCNATIQIVDGELHITAPLLGIGCASSISEKGNVTVAKLSGKVASQLKEATGFAISFCAYRKATAEDKKAGLVKREAKQATAKIANPFMA